MHNLAWDASPKYNSFCILRVVFSSSRKKVWASLPYINLFKINLYEFFFQVIAGLNFVVGTPMLTWSRPRVCLAGGIGRENTWAIVTCFKKR